MIGRKKCKQRYHPAAGSREAGVALAIVVWFIAGMSLLVAGIVAQARVDTQLAQIHADRARVTAAGDGAIRLAVASLEALSRSRAAGQSSNRQRFRVGEYMVEVQNAMLKSTTITKRLMEMAEVSGAPTTTTTAAPAAVAAVGGTAAAPQHDARATRARVRRRYCRPGHR